MSMKQWLIIIAMLFSLGLQAGEIYTTVFNVIDVNGTEKKMLLLLSGADGKVYRANRTTENVDAMKALIGRVVKLTFAAEGTKNYVVDVRAVNYGEIDEALFDLNHFQYNELRKFVPTNLKSVTEATDVFNNLLNDGDKNRSQCFKRAHMWAYDMWSQLGISSQKVFMFYTDRYQIIDEFDWWFHVAPMVTVNGVDYVMDGTFMKRPVTLKEWTDYFMKTNKINCPLITNYKHYEYFQWTKLCYTMKAPMYYFRPLDLELRDKKGIEKTHWVLPELQDARQAFKGWEDTYEGLDTGKRNIKH